MFFATEGDLQQSRQRLALERRREKGKEKEKKERENRQKKRERERERERAEIVWGDLYYVLEEAGQELLDGLSAESI